MYAVPWYPKSGGVKEYELTKTAYKKSDTGVAYGGKFIEGFYHAQISSVQGYIRTLKPKFIITLGKAALFSVLGESGIDDFRGSMEEFVLEEGVTIPVLPTHSPERIYKQPQLRFLVSRDLERVVDCLETGWPEPPWKICINPDYDTAIGKLQWL